MSLSQSMVRGFLAHLFVGEPLELPDDFYLGLTLNGSEVSAASYARQAYVPQYFDGLVSNLLPADFGVAAEDWGQINSFSLFDAATGGAAIADIPITHSFNIESGHRFLAPAGSVMIRS